MSRKSIVTSVLFLMFVVISLGGCSVTDMQGNQNVEFSKIEGVVLEAGSETPLADATVAVTDSVSTLTTKTDSMGQFSLVTETGNLLLDVNLRGYTGVSKVVKNTADQTSLDPVTLTRGEATIGVDTYDVLLIADRLSSIDHYTMTTKILSTGDFTDVTHLEVNYPDGYQLVSDGITSQSTRGRWYLGSDRLECERYNYGEEGEYQILLSDSDQFFVEKADQIAPLGTQVPPKILHPVYGDTLDPTQDLQVSWELTAGDSQVAVGVILTKDWSNIVYKEVVSPTVTQVTIPSSAIESNYYYNLHVLTYDQEITVDELGSEFNDYNIEQYLPNKDFDYISIHAFYLLSN